MSAKYASETKLFASRLRQEREKRAWTQSEVAERIRTTRVNISRWENGSYIPSPYYRQRLGELFEKSIQDLGFIPESSDERNEQVVTYSETDSYPSSRTAPPLWNVPYRRNPFFTGREAILTSLYTILRGSRKSAALTQAISGLGGIGKTQIAVEYAYRFRDHYKAIFWMNAATREVLSADFAALAALLALPEQHEQEQDIVVRAVRRWLTSHTEWLMILDNVESLETIIDFLPTEVMGDVLLTTRLQALGTVAQGIEVEKMGIDEGVVFLLRRSKVLSPHISPDQATNESLSQAAEIVVAMDGLPLALDQAAAYIEETRCGLSQYLKLFATRRKELLLRRGGFSVDHPDSVATTWSLSFQRVERENLASADLLRLLAFLNPEAIPEDIIHLGGVELGPTLRTVLSDPLQVNRTIELLLHYSLIRRTPEVGSLSIHRLVQAVLKDSMERDTQCTWAERAIRAVNSAFPEADLQDWERCQHLLTHVQMCAVHIDEYALVFPEASRLFNETALYLIAYGNYDESVLLLLRSLAIRREILGANHPDTARTMSDLGEAYRKQGKYQDAKILLQEALPIRQRTLGEAHPDVAQTLQSLANLYRAQGFYNESEQLYLHALHIRETTSGIKPTLVAQSYYGLARLYSSQERYQEAEKYGTKALDFQEKQLGNNHPDVASTLSLLAKIYQGQKKLDEAEEMGKRALMIQESISGEDHPHTATFINNLIEIYHEKRNYRDAEPLIARSQRIHEQLLGSRHPYMAYSLRNKAENLFLQGNYIGAETYYKEALAIREQNLGFNHPHTATIHCDLAKLYSQLERFEEAESAYHEALSVRERSFGVDSLSVASTAEQYAAFLRKMKRESEADELEAHAKAIRAKQIAPESL